MRRLLVLLLPIALLVTGCGSDAEAGHDRHDDNSEVPEGARTIPVRATSFEFDPPSIRVEAGEPIEIELRAEDAEHDFVVDELDAHVGASAGETARGGFTADEPGTYTYYRSVAGHRAAGMEGELVVG